MNDDEYEQARATYWEAQSAFRETAIAYIQQLIPDGYTGADFEFNDADPPRLSIVRLTRTDGEHDYFGSELGGDIPEDIFETIDMVASDMEWAHWDEATSRLFRTEDGKYLVIERSPA